MGLTQMQFMGRRFDCGAPDLWVETIAAAADSSQPFRFLVTPNTDHMVQTLEGRIDTAAYDTATWTLCDSRILGHLARRWGGDLMPLPGSDLVRMLLEGEALAGRDLAVVGPSEEDFARLAARYPNHRLSLIPSAPRLTRGGQDWIACRDAIEAAGCDLLFLCLSFPKQEYMAAELAQRGRAGGVGLCVGASIDFLTGKQTRAPVWMQRASLEWLYRLGSDPARLGKRYLVDGPRIFRHYLKAR